MANSTRSGREFDSFFHMLVYIVKFLHVALREPTYGELIDMFEDAERECPDDENLLYSKFKSLYPRIYVGRLRRFYETVRRVVAPTRASLRGDCKLTGSPLSSYRRRTWVPRIRNPAAG